VNGFVYLLSGSDLCAVTETVVVVLYLVAIPISFAVSYGCYLLTASVLSFQPPAETGTKTIDLIWMAIVFGNLSISMSLGAAMFALILIYGMGWRYRASLPARIIASLPVVRLMPYVHRKYWLPSGASLRPRPRSFYLKRLLIRQSELSCHIPRFILATSRFV
jgi:hypothetical protein